VIQVLTILVSVAVGWFRLVDPGSEWRLTYEVLAHAWLFVLAWRSCRSDPFALTALIVLLMLEAAWFKTEGI